MKSSIIRGKNQTLVWEYLQKRYTESGSATLSWDSKTDLSAALGIPVTAELIQQASTILSALEDKGVLIRLGKKSEVGRPVKLLMKPSGQHRLVPITDIGGEGAPAIEPLQFPNKTTAKMNSGTKMAHSVANANFFRQFFLEEKEKNPTAKIGELVRLASARVHERVESGNYRYLIGRNIDYTDAYLLRWVHGLINEEQVMEDLMPTERKSQPVTDKMINRILSSLELPKIDTSNLMTKDDLNSLRNQINDMKKEWNRDMNKLVVAIYSGANGPEKSAIAKFFPDVPAKANTIQP